MSQEPPALIPNNIRAFRQNLGWSLQKLAESCATSRSQIDKLEKGQRRLTTEWMVRLARPLGCDPRDLLAHPFAPPPTQTAQPQPLKEEPPALPLYGSTSAKDGNHQSLTRAPIDWTPRPYFLAHTKDAYALYMNGEQMVPMYRPRQLLFIDPHKPPLPGSGLMAHLKNGSFVIGQYEGQKKNGIALRFYAPRPHSRIFPFADLTALHAIVGATEPQ